MLAGTTAAMLAGTATTIGRSVMTRAYIRNRTDRYEIELWRRCDRMEAETLQDALVLCIHTDYVLLDGEYMSRESQDRFRLLGAEEVNDATKENH